MHDWPSTRVAILEWSWTTQGRPWTGKSYCTCFLLKSDEGLMKALLSSFLLDLCSNYLQTRWFCRLMLRRFGTDLGKMIQHDLKQFGENSPLLWGEKLNICSRWPQRRGDATANTWPVMCLIEGRQWGCNWSQATVLWALNRMAPGWVWRRRMGMTNDKLSLKEGKHSKNLRILILFFRGEGIRSFVVFSCIGCFPCWLDGDWWPACERAGKEKGEWLGRQFGVWTLPTQVKSCLNRQIGWAGQKFNPPKTPGWFQLETGQLYDVRFFTGMKIYTNFRTCEFLRPPWLECDHWPPPVDDHLELFLQGTGTTGSLLPENGEAELRYTYDPKDLMFQEIFLRRSFLVVSWLFGFFLGLYIRRFGRCIFFRNARESRYQANYDSWSHSTPHCT